MLKTETKSGGDQFLHQSLYFFSVSPFLYLLLLQILSFFHWMTSELIIASSLISILLTLLLISKSYGLRAQKFKCKLQELRISFLRNYGFRHLVFHFPIVSLVVLTFIAAVKIPPSNYDSMTYHLPRMEQWLQNQSVFGTISQIDRQMWNPKGSEMFLLFFRALFSKTDTVLNLVQWFTMISISILLYCFSRHRGLSHYVGVGAIYLLFSFPMVLLQSVTTQNDLIAGLFSLVAILNVYFYLRNDTFKRNPWLLACSIAVLCSVKGTTLILGALIVVFLSLIAFRSLTSIASPLSAFFCISLINSPTWAENTIRFGAPLSPSVLPEYNPLITNFHPSTFILNFIRMISTNFMWESSRANEYITNMTIKVLKSLHLDANDLDATWHGGFRPVFSRTEDYAGSPALPIILVLAIYFSFNLLVKKWGKTTFAEKSITIISCVFIFSTIYVLRWQPWINRLLIPIYVAAIVITVVWVSKTPDLKKEAFTKYLVIPMISFLMLNSTALIIFSQNRPYIDSHFLKRDQKIVSFFNMKEKDLRFMNLPAIKPQYFEAIREIEKRRPQTIIVYTSGDSWEYPLWFYLKKEHPNLQIKSFLRIESLGEEEKLNSIIVCIDVCLNVSQDIPIVRINVDN